MRVGFIGHQKGSVVLAAQLSFPPPPPLASMTPDPPSRLPNYRLEEGGCGAINRSFLSTS